MAHRDLGVGIVGCGNVSAAYLRLAPLFRGFEIRACADLQMDAARARASEFGLRAMPLKEMLKADDIDVVLNLTIPAAHFEVSEQAILSGRHVYSEKPFVLSLSEGRTLLRKAERAGLRVASAPDTFLGGAHQHARHLIDSGAIGRVTSGTAFMMNHGMEHWHPDPDFFYKRGAGPLFDMGPYYIANLVQLLGPVRRVAALASMPAKKRKISSRPRVGQEIAVETPTTIQSLLEFAGGASISFTASWDVWHHGHSPMELYGEDRSLSLPDPNFFGGALCLTRGEKPVNRLPAFNHPFGKPNEADGGAGLANYRGAGLADFCLAIAEGRPHRCSAELASHTVDVMNSILKSAETGRYIRMTTTCGRPEALDPAAARRLLAPKPRKQQRRA